MTIPPSETNADGSMILDHFTTANSDIISDNVYAVFADPGSNKVYVGTDVGVCAVERHAVFVDRLLEVCIAVVLYVERSAFGVVCSYERGA